MTYNDVLRNLAFPFIRYLEKNLLARRITIIMPPESSLRNVDKQDQIPDDLNRFWVVFGGSVEVSFEKKGNEWKII